MTSKILQNLIDKVTEKAYQNSLDWQKRDFSIASDLRSGIRSARVAFLEIDDQLKLALRDRYLDNSENTVADYRSILQQMLIALEPVWQYYRSLPSNYGEWECSALGIIEDEINRLIVGDYLPRENHQNQTWQE